MIIRGAPAIGVAAAMGLALGVQRSKVKGSSQLATEFYRLCELMADTRPTAVNLFWAIDRMKKKFSELVLAGKSPSEIKTVMVVEAKRIHDEDVKCCKALGAYGSVVVPEHGKVLTHCNAGALATGGYGTALGVIRAAVDSGKKISVIADETRPFFQGARLTAWELVRDGIETTIIADNMAGALMKDGQIDLVVVGADRIAANGDVANKIGTYTVAVLAHEHQLPFYVAAPISTIDLDSPDGSSIPIEERHAKELTHVGTMRTAPEGVRVWNPAFDITPHHLITGIITDRGICRKPFSESLNKICQGEGVSTAS